MPERDPNRPSYTELNPLRAMQPQLVKKGYLIPAAIAVVALLVMMVLMAKNQLAFWFLVACLVSAAEMGGIYALCGKRKPWWVLAGTVAFTGITLRIFGPIVGAANDATIYQMGTIKLYIGPGIFEELFKSIPIFLLALYAAQSKDPGARKIGVTEPLDGILIGAAAGFGFALCETFSQYSSTGELILWRFLENIFGHSAYSGYFGYFIGLAALRRKDSWKTLGMGWAFAFAVHNLWDFCAGNGILIGLAPVAVLSYAGFVACILKARQISPERRDNFATRRVSDSMPMPPPRMPVAPTVPVYHGGPQFQATAPVPAPIPQPRILLVGVSGPAAGERFSMGGGMVKLGRDPAECQIVLADRTGQISKVHCVVGLDSTGRYLFLEDNNSTNGTFLGTGQRVNPGQRITLPSNATFYLSTPAIMFQVVTE